jgi:hypothetical protein
VWNRDAEFVELYFHAQCMSSRQITWTQRQFCLFYSLCFLCTTFCKLTLNVKVICVFSSVHVLHLRNYLLVFQWNLVSGEFHRYLPGEFNFGLQLSLGVKRPGREADHSSPSSAEVKEWVELYIHFPYAFMAWCLVKAQGQLCLFTFCQSSVIQILWQEGLILSW